MPEGDTVWHTAAVLRDALAKKTLTRCDIRVPRYATVDLSGQVVDEVLSRGKHLFIRVGPASIHSHLKMDGSWRVSRRPVRTDHRVRILLETSNVQAIGVDLGAVGSTGTRDVMGQQVTLESLHHRRYPLWPAAVGVRACQAAV
jgi:endonuclease-8